MERLIKFTDKEYEKIWSEFNDKFKFKPSIHESDWPSFEEPAPSITYDISEYDDEDIDEWYTTASKVFEEITKEDEYIYFLNWQHESFFFAPHVRNSERRAFVPFFPDGDYYIYLASDMSFGMLMHPWEGSICIFGEKLLKLFSKYKPKMLRKVMRENLFSEK